MKTMLLAAVVLAGSAFAQAKAAPAPAGGGMDMSKVGPWSRKPANEKAVKKEIDDFFKAQIAAEAKGDMNAMVDHVDFPVYMVTDDSKGEIEAKAWDKDAYIAMMKPFYENMPKDAKTTHKQSITVLSDSLAAVSDDFVMTAGKQKLTGRNAGLLVKVAGTWKWKDMAEAGWAGMAPPKAPAAPEAAAPAAPAPKK